MKKLPCGKKLIPNRIRTLIRDSFVKHFCYKSFRILQKIPVYMYLPVPTYSTYHGIYTRTMVYITWLKSLKYLRPQVILSIKVCVVSFQKDLYPPISCTHLLADPPAFIYFCLEKNILSCVYFGCCSISGSVFLAEKPVVVLLLMWTVNIGPDSFLSASFISSGTANFYAMQEYADPHDFAGSEIL